MNSAAETEILRLVFHVRRLISMNYKLRRKQFYAWIGAAMLVGSLTACGDNAESKDIAEDK